MIDFWLIMPGNKAVTHRVRDVPGRDRAMSTLCNPVSVLHCCLLIVCVRACKPSYYRIIAQLSQCNDAALAVCERTLFSHHRLIGGWAR